MAELSRMVGCLRLGPALWRLKVAGPTCLETLSKRSCFALSVGRDGGGFLKGVWDVVASAYLLVSINGPEGKTG